MDRRKSICIGIPCYQGVPAETLDDYMRFAYHLGRRYQEFDFFLAIKSKSEQFRARNAIVEAALQVGADYILMLDDDHVIDTEGHIGPNQNHDFLRKLIEHDKPVIGTLYYQRGGECLPVLMTKYEGSYRFLHEREITGGLMEVDVQGGGCMLIKAEVFDKIRSPWFEPELEFGTDIQICRKAQEAGFSVWCDTSIELGHVLSTRNVITSANRGLFIEEANERDENNLPQDPWLKSYRQDVEAYLAENAGGVVTPGQIVAWARAYGEHMVKFDQYATRDDYYAATGVAQLFRQYYFHHKPHVVREGNEILSLFDNMASQRIFDFGCGSAPVGYELLARGHRITFVDVPGAGGYDFLRWRLSRNCMENWRFVYAQAIEDDHWPDAFYDTGLFLDSLEHIKHWDAILRGLYSRGVRRIVTNFFENQDYDNPEHINMDKEGVAAWLKDHGFVRARRYEWVKTGG